MPWALINTKRFLRSGLHYSPLMSSVLTTNNLIYTLYTQAWYGCAGPLVFPMFRSWHLSLFGLTSDHQLFDVLCKEEKVLHLNFRNYIFTKYS